VQQPQSPGASSTSSSNFEFSAPPTTPSSRTTTFSTSSPTPSTTPSVPKAVTKVLTSRTVQTTDQPKSTAWIRRNFLKQKNPSGNKAPP
jgi:hypothetical protein